MVGDDLDPAAVTARLGVEPAAAHHRGELIRRGRQQVPARTGSWSFSLGTEQADDWNLDLAVNALLDHWPEDPAAFVALVARYEVDLFCGLFLGTDNQSAELSAATLARLTERHLALSFDVYGPGPAV